jgi:hypothetical protein
MRTIEIRRHSYTKKGEARGRGSHLSAEGVALAREIGSQIGPFDLVLTSQSPRTLETAVAMGFAVDEQLEALGDIPQEVIEEIGHHERWAWEYPFLTFARFVDRGGPTARMGKRQEEAWMNALESAPANGKERSSGASLFLRLAQSASIEEALEDLTEIAAEKGIHLYSLKDWRAPVAARRHPQQ